MVDECMISHYQLIFFSYLRKADGGQIRHLCKADRWYHYLVSPDFLTSIDLLVLRFYFLMMLSV